MRGETLFGSPTSNRPHSTLASASRGWQNSRGWCRRSSSSETDLSAIGSSPGLKPVQWVVVEVLFAVGCVRAVDGRLRPEVGSVGQLGAVAVRRHVLEAAQEIPDPLECVPVLGARTGDEVEAAFAEGIDPVAVLPARRVDADDHLRELVADGGDGLGILVELPGGSGVVQAVGGHDEKAAGPAADRAGGQVHDRQPDRRDVLEAGGPQALFLVLAGNPVIPVRRSDLSRGSGPGGVAADSLRSSHAASGRAGDRGHP